MRRRLHPATWLLAWVAMVVVAQSLSAAGLAFGTAIALAIAVSHARSRTWTLLRRSRWLLVSIVVLFVLGTPGERLPAPVGDIGITYDGLLMAVEHAFRLVLLLVTLALLHQHLGTHGFMTGLYWLLQPIGRLRALRERIVVRLMLVLEYVERTDSGDWRRWLSPAREPDGPDRLELTMAPVGAYDWLLLATLAAGSAAFLAWRG